MVVAEQHHEKEPEWHYMWGAKVLACDACDDLIKEAVTVAQELHAKHDIKNDGQELAQAMKDHFDNHAKWSGNWVSVVGKSFGCTAIHQSKMFVYFYIGSHAHMLYKC